MGAYFHNIEQYLGRIKLPFKTDKLQVELPKNKVKYTKVTFAKKNERGNAFWIYLSGEDIVLQWNKIHMIYTVED